MFAHFNINTVVSFLIIAVLAAATPCPPQGNSPGAPAPIISASVAVGSGGSPVDPVVAASATVGVGSPVGPVISATVTAGISSPTAGTNGPASSSGNGSPSLPSQGGSPSSPTGNSPSAPGDVDSTGQQQCCDSLVEASDPSLAKLLSGLNVNVQSLTGLVGLNCSPIIGQAECGQRVHCEHVIHDILISLECVHVAL